VDAGLFFRERLAVIKSALHATLHVTLHTTLDTALQTAFDTALHTTSDLSEYGDRQRH
jgi:hypothetical protein